MRRLSIILFISSLLSTSCGNSGPTAAVTIPMGATGLGTAAYGTNPLTITAGTTVTWTNNDSMAHTATSDTAVFDSGNLAHGASFSFKFDTPGTYSYFCDIHGSGSMSGVIQVNN